MSSGIIGNLMGAYVIAYVNQAVFYMVLTAFCILASLSFLFLTKPEKANRNSLVERDDAIGASTALRDSAVD